LGAESVVLELTKETTLAGHQATIGVLENKHNPHLELAEIANSLNLRVSIFPCRSRFDLSTIKNIRNFICKEKPDIIHSHGYKSNFYALSAAQNKMPWVVTNHLWKRTSCNLRLYAYLDRFLIKYSKQIIAVSDEIATEMIKMGIPSNKIVVIDNGIDLRRFLNEKKNGELKRSFGLDINSRVIGTVASLTEEKGHVYLINAARDIILAFPETRFLFVGDGVERNHLEKKVAELGLQGKVILTGSRKDIPEILSILDVFVLPSLKEGLPMALLEAMAARTPVVASRVGAVPKVIVHNENGLLVEPGNSGSLYTGISELLSDPKKASSLGDCGYKKVKERFSSEAMATHYFDVYKKILNSSNYSDIRRT
jgi:glycosyltransferase involved in cell wall biosynthesis